MSVTRITRLGNEYDAWRTLPLPKSLVYMRDVTDVIN